MYYFTIFSLLPFYYYYNVFFFIYKASGFKEVQHHQQQQQKYYEYEATKLQTEDTEISKLHLTSTQHLWSVKF